MGLCYSEVCRHFSTTPRTYYGYVFPGPDTFIPCCCKSSFVMAVLLRLNGIWQFLLLEISQSFGLLQNIICDQMSIRVLLYKFYNKWMNIFYHGQFGHMARMDASLDISRALKTSIRGLPTDSKYLFIHVTHINPVGAKKVAQSKPDQVLEVSAQYC